MSAARYGQSLGQAACHARDAHLALVRMALVLDAGGLEVKEPLAAFIAEASEIADEMIRLADDCGHAEVAWRLPYSFADKVAAEHRARPYRPPTRAPRSGEKEALESYLSGSGISPREIAPRLFRKGRAPA
jgi:hypothetical protein